ASTFHPYYGSHLRVEHHDTAMHHGISAAKNMIGIDDTFSEAHWFWTDQYEHTLQQVERARPDDELVVRGPLDELSFLAFSLRDGPGRTREPVARALERAVSRAMDAGLDPKGLTVAASRVEPGEDIVRVRRKAHGKADWITSVTSNISVELVPTGMYQSEHVQADPVELRVVPSAQAPTGGDASHPLGPEIRDS